MKIRIDVSRCVTSGHCVVEAPTVFDQDPDTGLVILLKDVPDESEREQVRSAARLCPVVAIEIDEDSPA